MALGSLLDAGAPTEEVTGLLERLPLPGWRLRVDQVMRGGVAATSAVVEVTDDVVVRTHTHIAGLIEEARLPDRITKRSLAAFSVLADVEGRLHKRSPAHVHFHEVGGHDAIIEIVGVMAALEVLGVDEVSGSTVATGHGTVRSAHGLLPNPSPAVVELLRGIPVRGVDTQAELTTPTGAAILAALATDFGPMPAMRVFTNGFGAGQRELEGLPNCTQVVIGDALGSEHADGQPLVLLEANLDDATGETLAHAVAAIIGAGAYDAWLTPIVMKKGRPGHIVSAIAEPSVAGQVRATLTAETGSLGVRSQTVARWAAERAAGTVEVEGSAIRVKVTSGRVKVEQADAAEVAARTGLPLREVIFRAEVAWRESERRGLTALDTPLSRPRGGDGLPSGPEPA
jgi:uncharacterized protein (TIGR00299 family) protein